MGYLRTPTYRRALHVTRAPIVLLSALLLLSWNYGVRADGALGDLDPGFGTNGKVMTDFVVNGTAQSTYLSALALQPDGKLVAGGSIGPGAFALARYNPDGSLDSSFGVGGKVITDFGTKVDWADLRAVRIMTDGRILVACNLVVGYGGAGSLMARYTAEGNLDTSFGDGGKLMDRSIAISDLVVQADGHIVVSTFYGLIRFNPDGTHRESFGNDSQLPIRAQMYWLAQQSDGRIVAAGTESAAPSEAFVLIRFRSDGSLDPTFGTAGVVTTEMPGGSTVTEVAVMAEGRIQVLGLTEWTRKRGYSRLALVRYHTDGSLDISFGEGGRASTDFGAPYVFPSFAVQPDGHIVVADNNLFNPTDDFEMIRFNPNGSLDLSFGYAGVARTDFSGRQDSIKALVAVGNDRIVAAGPSRGTEDSCFALACFIATGTPHEPDFELGFSSSVINATRGTRARIAVNLYRFGGFSGDVTVTPPDLSAEGIICKAPEPVTVSGTTASWKFKIKGRAAPGPHQLTFIGRDAAGRERSATVTLFVD